MDGHPLQFNDQGQVKETFAYNATKDGIVVGAMVEATEKVKKTSFRRVVKQGERGMVTAVGEFGVVVRFNEQEGGLPVPRTAFNILVDNPPADRRLCKKRVDSPADESADEQAFKKMFIQWNPIGEDDSGTYIIGHIRNLLYHLVSPVGPTSHELGFEDPTSLPIALREFRAQELKLFPYSSHISETAPQTGVYFTVTAAVADTPSQQFYIISPRLATERAATDVGPSCCVSPFWNAVGATENAHELQFANHTFILNMGINCNPTAKAKGINKVQIKQKAGPAKIQVTVPYLLNTDNVPLGASIKAAGLDCSSNMAK